MRFVLAIMLASALLLWAANQRLQTGRLATPISDIAIALVV
jgi:hypothetical protein